MQANEHQTESQLFEVMFRFKDESWAFFTSAHASILGDALEQAEREFSSHLMRHRLGSIDLEATSAQVIHAQDQHSFTKENGKWRHSH